MKSSATVAVPWQIDGRWRVGVGGGAVRGAHFVIRKASRSETAGWWASQLFSRELVLKNRISSFKETPRGRSWSRPASWHYQPAIFNKLCCILAFSVCVRACACMCIGWEGERFIVLRLSHLSGCIMSAKDPFMTILNCSICGCNSGVGCPVTKKLDLCCSQLRSGRPHQGESIIIQTRPKHLEFATKTGPRSLDWSPSKSWVGLVGHCDNTQ